MVLGYDSSRHIGCWLSNLRCKNITFSSNCVCFDDTNEQMAAFELLQNTYSKSDNVLIVLLPKSGDAFDRNSLNAVNGITELNWQLPYSSRVDSLVNYQHSHAIKDDLIVKNLIENVNTVSNEEIERVR